MTEPATILALIGLLATLGLYVNTWLREGRQREWALADATERDKQQREAAALLAKELRESAAALATKVNVDADRVHASAETLVTKVAENTAISTEAAQGASKAIDHANTFNQKIADLQEQIVLISGKFTEYIEKTNVVKSAADKATHEEAIFNQRVKAAIDQALLDLNGSAPAAFRRKRKST